MIALSTCIFVGFATAKEMVRHDIPADIELAIKPMPSTSAPMPTNFSWRELKLLAPSSNQHVPQYCGGCFLFAAFHVLQDRVKIARQLMQHVGTYAAPDPMAAHQVFLNCGAAYGSCTTGGSAPNVWRWVRDFGGVPTAGCQPYLAIDGTCSPENICRNCMPSPGTEWTLHREYSCWAVLDEEGGHACEGNGWCATGPFPRIKVADFGKVTPSADAMAREIFRAGPIACNVDAQALTAYRSGIVHDPPGHRNANDTDHVIEIVGFGVEDTMPYWEIRNSWGEYWGELGFAKIYRGRNDMLIESACFWVEPEGWGVPGTPNWQTYLAPHESTPDAATLFFHNSPSRLVFRKTSLAVAFMACCALALTSLLLYTARNG